MTWRGSGKGFFTNIKTWQRWSRIWPLSISSSLNTKGHQLKLVRSRFITREAVYAAEHSRPVDALAKGYCGYGKIYMGQTMTKTSPWKRATKQVNHIRFLRLPKQATIAQLPAYSFLRHDIEQGAGFTLNWYSCPCSPSQPMSLQTVLFNNVGLQTVPWLNYNRS